MEDVVRCGVLKLLSFVACVVVEPTTDLARFPLLLVLLLTLAAATLAATLSVVLRKTSPMDNFFRLTGGSVTTIGLLTSSLAAGSLPCLLNFSKKT